MPARAARVMDAGATGDADVVIAGAGPGGAALAARLADAGVDVLACDKARFPRDTLCGEFVSPDGIAALERLGLRSELDALGASRIDRFALTAPGTSRALERPLPAPALGLSRRLLDDILVRHARRRGARVAEGTRIVSVTQRKDGMQVIAQRDGEPIRWVARCVVDASGRLGGLRIDGEHEASPPFQVGVQQHRRIVEPWAPRVELHAFRGGYVGLNAIEGGLVTCCALVETGRLHRGRADLLFESAAAENAHLARRLATLGEQVGPTMATARPHPGRRLRQLTTFALGDAAGMIAPACGDGIAMALESAELLAPHVVAHLNGLDLQEARRRWLQRHGSTFGGRLGWGRLLEGALLRPAVTRAVIAAGRTFPFLADAAARATRGPA